MYISGELTFRNDDIIGKKLDEHQIKAHILVNDKVTWLGLSFSNDMSNYYYLDII